MTGELKLNPDEFYQSALAFIPITEDIKQVTRTSRTDSAALAVAIGGGDDEMAAAFAPGYNELRQTVLTNGGTFATSFDMFREAFVDAHDEYVERDDSNGEFTAIVGREITTEDGQTVTPQSGQGILPNSDGGLDTPEDIADDLNTLEDAQETAQQESEDDYS